MIRGCLLEGGVIIAARGRESAATKIHGSHQASQKHQSQGSQTQCPEDQCETQRGGQEPGKGARNLDRHCAT